MKPSLKQQFVSQEPGKVDCNGGEEGGWRRLAPGTATTCSRGFVQQKGKLVPYTVLHKTASVLPLTSLDISHFIRQYVKVHSNMNILSSFTYPPHVCMATW